MAAHAKFGASKAHRFLACPGSIRMEAKFPDQQGPDARMGTLAHRVCEKALKNGNDALDYLGKEVLLEDGSFGIPDQEMVEACQIFVDEVRALEGQLPGSKVESERHGLLEWLDKDVGGTTDATVRQPFGTLVILDYKHGKGVPVDVVEDDGTVNAQTMIYALAGLGPLPKSGVETFEEVVVGIIQPRSFHPDGPIRYAAPMTPEQIREWGDKVLMPGVKAAKKSNAPLAAGDHCRFCKAAQGCPEIQKQAMSVAQEAFADTDNPETTITDPAALTVDQISRVLGLQKLLKGWLKAVESRALHLLAAGESVPGFKLVAKKTHRKWTNPATVQAVLEMGDIDPDLYMSAPTIKTVAQVEKALEKAKIELDLSDLIYKPQGAAIALVTDKRSAFVPASADQMFDTIEDGEEE